jgi:hypothetical protein
LSLIALKQIANVVTWCFPFFPVVKFLVTLGNQSKIDWQFKIFDPSQLYFIFLKLKIAQLLIMLLALLSSVICTWFTPPRKISAYLHSTTVAPLTEGRPRPWALSSFYIEHLRNTYVRCLIDFPPSSGVPCTLWTLAIFITVS